ncbi:exosortase-associated EpsI family protein [Lentisalinibacter sediminis]|uniref:exosortase-associated EpsI family protein n=1 Tax=Lentisalinibacter sediminis TaxID=2992237 RepID=UPI0038647F4C
MRRWAGLIAYAGSVGLVLLLHAEAVASVSRFWNEAFVYGHGTALSVLVLAAAGYYLARLQPFEESPPLLVGMLLVISGVLLKAVTVADVVVGQMIMLHVLAWLAVAYVFGLRAGVRLLSLFAALVFTWSVWDVLVAPLQMVTAKVNNLLLDLTGRTAYVRGDTVYVAAGTFVIERGCAGLNYFIAACSLAALYGFWFLRTVPGRILAVLVAMAAAMAANWLRVFIVVVAGDMTDMQSGLVEDHVMFGWFVFAAVMLALLLLAQRYLPVAAEEKAPPGMEGGGADGGSDRAVPSTGRALAPAALGVLLLSLPSLGVFALARAPAAADPLCTALPERVSEWRRVDQPPPAALSPEFPDARVRWGGAFESEAGTLHAWYFGYRLGEEGAEVVGYPNRWFDPGEWRRATADTAGATGTLDLAGPRVVRLSRGSESRVIAAGYVFGARVSGHALVAKVWRAASELRGRDTGHAVAVSVGCAAADCDAAAQMASGFFRRLEAVGFCAEQ